MLVISAGNFNRQSRPAISAGNLGRWSRQSRQFPTAMSVGNLGNLSNIGKLANLANLAKPKFSQTGTFSASNILCVNAIGKHRVKKFPFERNIFLCILKQIWRRIKRRPATTCIFTALQLDAQKMWTITFAPSERIPFRRPTREPLPTLMNFNFFPHSKMFSKTENFLLDNTLYLEIKFANLPDPEGATPSSFNP